MANPTLVLWCDAAQNRLYKGWQSSQVLDKPQLKQGDTISVEIHWLSSLGTGGVEEYAFSPSSNVILAVGLVDADPSAGTFTLTYDGDTTAPIPYNATATQLETALNALASITAEGGVEVEKNGAVFRIVWADAGVFTESLTANTDELSPSSNAAVAELRAGTATLQRIILLNLKQSPIAACTTFTASPAPSLTVTNVLANSWRLKLDPLPKGGSFNLSFTAGFNTYTSSAIPFDASAGQIQTTLNLLLDDASDKFTVNTVGYGSWEINCPQNVIIDGVTLALGSITANSALIGFNSVVGILDMNTANVEEFLGGEALKDCSIEVQVEQDGSRQTIIQSPCTVVNDLISTSVFTLVDMGEVMPVDSVVRFDTSQTLTSGEQLQARTNIGAASDADVSVLTTDVATLQGQLSSISGSILTNDQVAAITGSASPSASNVVITTSALTTGLATKANTVHTHTASQISDSTTAGRALLTAADLAAQQTLLGITGGPFAPIASPTFTGTVTIPAGASISGYLTTAAASSTYLAKTNNLSELTSATAARLNLGLGTMATETASNYLAKSDNLSGLASTSIAKTNLGLGTSDSPQFTATFFGGTSGNYSTASGTAISTYAIGGQYVTIQPTGITANSANGFSLIVPANGDTAKIAKTGQYNGEYGIWYGAAGGDQTGITKSGIRFPDGTLQTTAGDGGFNTTLVEAFGTNFIRNIQNSAIFYEDYIYDTNQTGVVDVNNGQCTEATGWVYSDTDFIFNDTQYRVDEPAGNVGRNAMTRSISDQNWCRIIVSSARAGYSIIRQYCNAFLSNREVKYLTRPTSTTAWSANQGGSLSENTLRMDKPWKYSFNVMMFVSLEQPYGSSYTQDAHTGSYSGGSESNINDNWGYFSFGLSGEITPMGYGDTGTSYGDNHNGGIARFAFNRATGQLLFKYPKSQRGSPYGYANTWILPTYGEVGVSLPDPSFLTGEGAICMDVEITNLATSVLNQDNSNTMKVRLEIYSPNQVSTQVVEFTVTDAVSPIEIESPTGTILCARDAYCVPLILAGVRAAVLTPSEPYIDIQTSNMKFAYID